MNKKEQQIKAVEDAYVIVRFSGATFYRAKDQTTYHRLTNDEFHRIAYATLGRGITEGNIKEMAGYFYTSSPDITDTHGHLIAMPDNRVWDMRALEFVAPPDIVPIYRSKITPAYSMVDEVNRFVLDLANGDQSVQSDIFQSLAPFFMERKPVGVIWFYGNGQNGKSSLIEALSRIIGDHLASVSLEGIEKGRNTPQLNGSLGNLVRESSEAYVENSANYKSLGTHEPFMVDRMYSQEPILIKGNIHSVFNANNLPTFADKSRGISRRTFTVPFNNIFPVDVGFEDRTFTREFLGSLLHLVLEHTKVIANNGYQYQWSEASIQLKQTYDDDQDSTRTYLTYLRDEHPSFVGFRSYARLNLEYETWCARTGSTKMGVKSLKKTFRDLGGVEERKIRIGDDNPRRYYIFDGESTTGVDDHDGLLLRPGDLKNLEQVPIGGL